MHPSSRQVGNFVLQKEPFDAHHIVEQIRIPIHTTDVEVKGLRFK